MIGHLVDEAILEEKEELVKNLQGELEQQKVDSAVEVANLK